MSVAPSTTVTIYQLIGTNLGPLATVWPYAVHTEVKVYLDRGDGAGAVLLTEGPDYTLTPTLPTLTNGGEVLLDGSLLTPSPWPTDILPGAPAWVDAPTLTLLRDTPDGQPSAFGEMEGFSPEACEAALDNLARQIQEVDDKFARTVRDQVNAPGWDVPDELVRRNQVVRFDQYGQWALGPAEAIVGGGFYVITFGLPGPTIPAAGEPFEDHPLPCDLEFPANFVAAGWTGSRAAPTADFTIAWTDQLGAAKGQVVLHPDGSASFTTPGAAIVAMSRGDVLRPTCQAGVDASLVGPAVTLLARIVG